MLKFILNRVIIANQVHFALIMPGGCSRDLQSFRRTLVSRLTPSEEHRIRIVSSYTVLLLVTYLRCITCAARCYNSDCCIILVYSRLFPNYSGIIPEWHLISKFPKLFPNNSHKPL